MSRSAVMEGGGGGDYRKRLRHDLSQDKVAMPYVSCLKQGILDNCRHFHLPFIRTLNIISSLIFTIHCFVAFLMFIL